MKRRTFFLAAASAVAGFHVVPRTVLGGAGLTAPSDRIVLAHIGMGWFGSRALREPWSL